jgi:dipeptidyl aminopeptidase/acylaminoacyl peptidase
MLIQIIRKIVIVKIWMFGIFLSTNISADNQSSDKHLLDLLNQVKCHTFSVPDLVSGFDIHVAENYQIKDIQFSACDGKKIQAYLVRPLENVKHQAAVLYVHWLDPSAADSNRNEFLNEAKTLAAKGFSSLLVSTFWSIPGGYYMERRWQDDYQNTLHQLKDLQHATGLLKSLPGVDSKHLIFVGHDYGGTFGAMLLGIDNSFASAVLMTAIADISDWYTYGSATGMPEGKALVDFKQQFSLINPQNLIQYSNAKLFFQFSKNDPFISQKQAEALYIKAPKTAKVKFYDVGHSLKNDAATADRLQWLEEK